MNIDLELRKGTLHEASKDDNGSYLLENGEEEVYLFDDISQDVADILRNKKKLKSVDALSIVKKDDKVYFIEFKNTRHAHMPKNELYLKAHDSVCTYLISIEPDISLNKTTNLESYVK